MHLLIASLGTFVWLGGTLGFLISRRLSQAGTIFVAACHISKQMRSCPLGATYRPNNSRKGATCLAREHCMPLRDSKLPCPPRSLPLSAAPLPLQAPAAVLPAAAAPSAAPPAHAPHAAAQSLGGCQVRSSAAPSNNLPSPAAAPLYRTEPTSSGARGTSTSASRGRSSSSCGNKEVRVRVDVGQVGKGKRSR